MLQCSKLTVQLVLPLLVLVPKVDESFMCVLFAHDKSHNSEIQMSYLQGLGAGLCIADFASTALVVMIRHRSHELELWQCTSSAIRSVVTLVAFTVLQPRAHTPLRLFALLALCFTIAVCSVLFPHLHESHYLELAISTTFALGEFFLLCLLAPQYLVAVTKDTNADDLEAQLLQEEECNRDNIDPYKGQGATFRRLVSLSYPERYILVTATFALFISSIGGLITPLLFGQFIESINADQKSMHKLNETILELILLFVVSSAFSMLRGALFTLAGERLVSRFRTRLFDHIMFQDIAFFDTNQSGELQSRLSSDTGAIQNAVTVNFSMSLRMIVQAVCSFVVIFFISWKLTLVMLSVVPVVGVCARMYGTFVKTLSKNYQDSLAKASETAEEAFSSIRTVRSFSRERHQVAKYATRIDTAYQYGKRRAWAYGTFLGGIGLLGSLAVCLVLWMGGKMVIKQEDGFTPAKLTTFMMYTLNLAMALGGLSELFSSALSALGASTRMFTLLDTDPAIDSRGDDSKVMTTHSSNNGAMICFDHVSFAYPTRKEIQVLNDISFQLIPRSVNAFVGSSGGGKSTICSLLQRFYDPICGDITIDGVSLKNINPQALRDRMSVVSQEPTLFALSIRDNIAFGARAGDEQEPTMEEIVEAAKRANAYDFIMSFKPDGFNTMVGERGVQLSGGQKQRIAIARAILKNPDILLLDEATSALDSESEFVVQQALDELMQHRTTVVVAHRVRLFF